MRDEVVETSRSPKANSSRIFLEEEFEDLIFLLLTPMFLYFLYYVMNGPDDFTR